jgi:hypothetical protein
MAFALNTLDASRWVGSIVADVTYLLRGFASRRTLSIQAPCAIELRGGRRRFRLLKHAAVLTRLGGLWRIKRNRIVRQNASTDS